jgi:hypothetical protein
MLTHHLPAARPTHLAETTMRNTQLRTFFTRRSAIGAIAAGILLAFAPGVFAADEPAKQELNVPPKGFVALFNGKDLSGWKGLVLNPRSRPTLTEAEWPVRQKRADDRMNKHWHVVDGVLMFDGAQFNMADNICTVKDYKNFELLVDWKIEKGGDTGVYLRGSPQVQIWDPDNPKEHKNGAEKGSGALWNNSKHERFPLVRADNPIGEWNTFHIRMVGDRVSVWLNGKLVTDNVVMENYWDRSKPMYASGSIELQNHNHPLYFRNIFVKELP